MTRRRRRQGHPAPPILSHEEKERRQKHARKRRQAVERENKRGAGLGISKNDDAARWLAEHDPFSKRPT